MITPSAGSRAISQNRQTVQRTRSNIFPISNYDPSDLILRYVLDYSITCVIKNLELNAMRIRQNSNMQGNGKEALQALDITLSQILTDKEPSKGKETI